jgi:hypothetical protein
MTRDEDRNPALTELLNSHDGVLSTGTAMKYLTRDALRWRVSSGRWQQPCRGIVVAHSGPLTEVQALRIAVLWAGPGATLAGLTAARLDGLAGFEDRGKPPAERPVDGIHHIDATEYWADMDRDIDFTLGGYRVLRFPAFVVRYHGDYVAGKIREALGLARPRIEIPA